MEGVFMILLANVDIILVGTLGVTAIAAVSIFTQPRLMILTLARTLSSVVTLLTAENYGQGQTQIAGKILRATLLVWGVILTLLHALFFSYLADILLWMGAEENYLPLALRYADIALVAVWFTSLTAIMQGVMLGFGDAKAVLQTNLQGNIVNLLLSAALIFGWGIFPAMGVTGAAIGTLVGTIYTFGGTLLYLRQENLLGGSWLPDKNYWRALLPVFGGVFGEQGFERLGMVLYTRLVAGLGAMPYAVHAICMNFCDFYYSFAGGLGKASMVLTGQARGQKNTGLLLRYIAVGNKWCFIFSALACIMILMFRQEILALYAADSEALALGSVVMLVVAAVSFPEGKALTSAGALRGCGKTTAVAIYSFVSIALLRPLVTWLFVYTWGWGLMGAWLALALDQSARAVSAEILLYRVRRCLHEKDIQNRS
ncbi:MAG: MATE family efflux transporter [Selenomonadaceae bacterium]|nr:MATE family efflux transporter [Selenomonadaceae bacterium]